jgi:hypothetical protein
MAMPNISAICAVVGIGLIVIPLNIAASRKRQETKSMRENRAREAVNMPPTYSAQGKNKNKNKKQKKRSSSGLGFKSTGQSDTAPGLQMEILLVNCELQAMAEG